MILVEKVVCIHLVTKGDMKLVADRFSLNLPGLYMLTSLLQ